MLTAIEIATFLKSVVPYTYFVNDFPAKSPDASAFVRLLPGSPPSQWSNVIRPGFQVVIRGTRQADNAVEAIAFALLGEMHNRIEFTIAGKRVVHSFSEQSYPFYIGTDDNGRPLYSTNFEMTMQS